MKTLTIAALACLATVSISGYAAAQIRQQAQGNRSAINVEQETLDTCFVESVAAFPDRVHILCSSPQAMSLGGVMSSLNSGSNSFRYFAVENDVSQNAMALTVLSVANAAIQSNRALTIVYRTNPSENPAGCLVNDCRRIVGVSLN